MLLKRIEHPEQHNTTTNPKNSKHQDVNEVSSFLSNSKNSSNKVQTFSSLSLISLLAVKFEFHSSLAAWHQTGNVKTFFFLLDIAVARRPTMNTCHMKHNQPRPTTSKLTNKTKQKENVQPPKTPETDWSANILIGNLRYQLDYQQNSRYIIPNNDYAPRNLTCLCFLLIAN